MKYAFVDGNHLRVTFGETVEKLFDQKVAIDFLALRDRCGASKLFYYDAVDYHSKDKETAEAKERRVAEMETELDRIQATPGCHVRRGETRGRSSKRRDTRQKMVDVQLAVDAMQYAANGNYEHVVIITGDLDFKPLVEALVNLGKQVAVWHGPSAPRDLLDAADERRPLTLSDLYQLATPQPSSNGQALPTVQEGLNLEWQGWTVQGRVNGVLGGVRCYRASRPSMGDHIFACENVKGVRVVVAHRDEGVLRRFVEMTYAGVEWDA
jgi:uncharacterized LabA/DUF88 family protein